MEKQAERLAGGMAGRIDRPPLIVSPYDAELYGHWWYEGPIFIGDLFRQMQEAIMIGQKGASLSQ